MHQGLPVARALSVLLLSPLAVSSRCDAEDPGADLYCGACELFIDSYLMAANGPVFHTKRDSSPRGVYKQRISAIYKEHAPEKLRLVEGMLKYYKGKEHSLYQKVCYKYNTAIEPAYTKEDAESPEEEIAWKESQARGAMDKAVKDVKKEGTQWAVKGKEGERKYVDFNKAMNSGDQMDNLSMGGDVGKKIAECFEVFIEKYAPSLAAALANSARLYDSGIDKTFCYETTGMCKREDPESSSDGESTDALSSGEADAPG